MKFDPETGELIQETQETETVPYQDGEQVLYSPMMEPKKKKSKIGFIIAGAVLVLLVASAAVAFAGMKSGLFLNPNQKIAKAVGNTFSEGNPLLQEIQAENLLKAGQSGEYTSDIVLNVEEAGSLDLSCAIAKEEVQVSGNLKIEQQPDVEFYSSVDRTTLELLIPMLDDRVIVYDYQKPDRGGAIEQVISTQELDEIDSTLKTFFTQKQDNEAAKKMSSAFVEQYQNMKFTKVDKEEFQIDGKDKKCTGYQTILTEETVNSFLDILDDAMGGVTDPNQLNQLSEYADSIAQLRDEIENMENITVTVYLQDMKLAAVTVREDEFNYIEVKFKGGDYRTQDMEFTYCGSGEMVGCELVEKTKDNTITYDLTVMSDNVTLNIANLTYDTENGDYKAVIDAGDTTGEVSGNLNIDSDSLTLMVNNCEINGEDAGMNGAFSMKTGAKFEELKGEKVKLMDLTELDFTDMYLKAYAGY